MQIAIIGSYSKSDLQETFDRKHDLAKIEQKYLVLYFIQCQKQYDFKNTVSNSNIIRKLEQYLTEFIRLKL